MGDMVSSEDVPFGKELGLLHEVVVTGRKAGADRDFWVILSEDPDLFEAVVAVVEAGLKVDIKADLPTEVEPPNRSEEKKWRLVTNTIPSHKETMTVGLAKVLMAHDKGGLAAYKLLERAERCGGKPCLGQVHADALWMVRDQIPKPWRKHKLFFAGTVWAGDYRLDELNSGPHGPGFASKIENTNCIFYLQWCEKKEDWELKLMPLYGYFHSDVRFVVPLAEAA